MSPLPTPHHRDRAPFPLLVAMTACGTLGMHIIIPALPATARALGMSRIRWCRGSWFEAVPGERFDMILSNPPYVAAADPALRLLRAEPELALTPGPSGYEAFEAIVAAAARHLNPSGVLAFEHGGAQAGGVAALFERGGFQGIICFRDAAGLPRVSLAEIHSTH